MDIISIWRQLNTDQRNAFAGSFLGWTLDAFDFFLLVFVLKYVAHDFHTSKTGIALAITLTLAFRPVGALLFGLAADRFGRRGPLMLNIVFYSTFELLTAFAPNLATFLALRALFGIGMGGEWGLGASLALESVRPEQRGTLSGLLQEGYVCGYLLAAIVFGLVFPYSGWRGMFVIGAVPALLSLFILARVKESPAWLEMKQAHDRPGAVRPAGLWREVRAYAPSFFYLVLLMTAFNFMSHGAQDLYPTFLQVQRKLSDHTVSLIAVVYNFGALAGGLFVGSLSQRIGRRKAIVIAALLSVPVVPLWVHAHSVAGLAVGAFLLLFFTQGAWGVIPAHLSELAPAAVRGTFIGLAYQTGNLIASVNATLESGIAGRRRDDYALALSIVIWAALAAVALITAFGPERKGAALEAASPEL